MWPLTCVTPRVHLSPCVHLSPPYHHGDEGADIALLHDDVAQGLQGQPLRRTPPAWHGEGNREPSPGHLQALGRGR